MDTRWTRDLVLAAPPLGLLNIVAVGPQARSELVDIGIGRNVKCEVIHHAARIIVARDGSVDGVQDELVVAEWVGGKEGVSLRAVGSLETDHVLPELAFLLKQLSRHVESNMTKSRNGGH